MPSVKRILIADDDPDDIFMFKDALIAEAGNEITLNTAFNGIQLLHKLDLVVELPEMIFLDINMPGENGLECLKIIKGHKKYNGVKVIMHSTTDNIEMINVSYKLGADLYIVKATNFDNVCKNIRKCIFYDWEGPDFYDDELKRPSLEDHQT